MQDDFVLARLALRPDHSGALHLPEERTLVVADLHLEKGSAFAARGTLLPPYDSAATLAALAAAILRLQPARVIALGDSFHDRDGPARLAPEGREALRALQRGRDWLWIAGNHDPQPDPSLGGQVLAQVELGGAVLRHAPDPAETKAEIAGHLHPAARISLRGRSLRRRCFARSAGRCILPAFGAYAGGLNLRDAAFRPLLTGPVRAHMIGDGRLFHIDGRLLQPD